MKKTICGQDRDKLRPRNVPHSPRFGGAADRGGGGGGVDFDPFALVVSFRPGRRGGGFVAWVLLGPGRGGVDFVRDVSSVGVRGGRIFCGMFSPLV